jgi:predicted nucleic acid-binding protein
LPSSTPGSFPDCSNHRQSDTVNEDAMIAATAIHSKLIIVTRNIKDFKRFNVKLLNPFGAH